MNKITYEILGSNKVKIIEEITTSSETVVDYSAVEKRVSEIQEQMSVLQVELEKWNNLLNSTKNTIITDEITKDVEI